MEKDKALHVAMFPWLAMGHLIPFLHLAKLLAPKGHRISFISTPRNLSRLPKIPTKFSSRITLVPLPLPSVPNLPSDLESSIDVPYSKQQLLKAAFDLLSSQLVGFLRSEKPDWIIYDYASHWLPPLAAELNISRAFFSLFNAATLAFIGPPSVLIDGADSRFTAESFTVLPEWIAFESNVVFRLHEVTNYFEKEEADGPPDTVRFGVTIQESEVVIVRSCIELEPEWFDLLVELYKKPVIPVGFLPPVIEDEDGEDDNNWVRIKAWLDRQRVNSVVYVSLGTEAILQGDQLSELALGLEKSGLPFFWVLRTPPGSTQGKLNMLPDGFEKRVKGRGMIHVGWVPQVRILSHNSVGGSLTHCGWNSVIEALGFGRVLILLPMLNEQGLNSRLLHGNNLGVEVPRDERDGSFTSESVAESVRIAMVEDSGERLRAKSKEMSGLFGDKDRNGRHVDELVRYLEDNRFPR